MVVTFFFHMFIDLLVGYLVQILSFNDGCMAFGFNSVCIGKIWSCDIKMPGVMIGLIIVT